jgi:hypothetical protein
MPRKAHVTMEAKGAAEPSTQPIYKLHKLAAQDSRSNQRHFEPENSSQPPPPPHPHVIRPPRNARQQRFPFTTYITSYFNDLKKEDLLSDAWSLAFRMRQI